MELTEEPAAEPESAKVDANQLRAKAIQGTGWTAIQVLAGRLISLAVFVVLARLLTPAEIGLVGLALLLVDFMQMFASQGFFDAIIQRSKLDKEHLDTGFWANLVVGLAFTLGAIATAPLIAWALSEPKVSPVFQWLSPMFVFLSITGVYRAVLQRDLAFDRPAVLVVLGDMFGGIVGIASAAMGCGVWSLVALQLTAKGSSLVLFAASSSWQPGLRFSWQALKDLYSFGLSMIANKVLAFSSRRFTELLIQQFFGVAVLGLFNVANRILVTFNQVAFGVVRPVAFSTMSRLQHDTARVRSYYYSGTQILSLLVFPIFIGFAHVADLAIPLFFGPQWHDAILLVRILTLPVLIQSVVLTLTTVTLQATGRPSLALMLDGIYGVMQVVGFFAVVLSGGGVRDVAWMFALTASLTIPLALWLLRNRLDLSIGVYLQQLRTPILASLVMSAALYLCDLFVEGRLHPAADLVVQVVVGGISFVVAVAYLDAPLLRRVTDMARMIVDRRSRRAENSQAT